MVTSDCYIMDCYTGYPAYTSDEQIMRHVLEAHHDELHDILVEGKTTLFVDRGFRNIYNELKDREFGYNLNPQIPFCPHLHRERESDPNNKVIKQLAANEVCKTRNCTKVKFFKVIYVLKNFYFPYTFI